MFGLSTEDLHKKIISFGDEPASFIAGMNEIGNKVVSLDPIYIFSPEQIQDRVEAAKNEIITQPEDNKHLNILSCTSQPAWKKPIINS